LETHKVGPRVAHEDIEQGISRLIQRHELTAMGMVEPVPFFGFLETGILYFEKIRR